MKIELKEKECSGGYGYEVTVSSANPKSVEKVYESLEEYKEDWLSDDANFYISEYVDAQDQVDIVEYYGSITNEFENLDSVVEYAGVLTSFEKDGNKLFLTIENAGMPYDEEEIKLFFFSGIIDSEEDKIATLNKLESEIKELEKRKERLKIRIKEIKEGSLSRNKGTNGKYGFVDYDGNWVVEPKFEDAEDFQEGFACVKLDDKCGFIKADGTYLVEPKFDDAEGFCEGLAEVVLDGRYGFIKTDCTYLVEPKFDDAWPFREGFAKVKLGHKWGYIKTDGTYLIEPKFDDAWSFRDGFARVILEGKEGEIDTDGKFTSYDN